MTSPWDAAARDVTVLRSEEHSIIGVHVVPPAGGDDRFSIEFRTTGDRVLRVCLPGDQLQSLARVLTEVAGERLFNSEQEPVKSDQKVLKSEQKALNSEHPVEVA
jgi:hypothetical protein